MNKILILLIIGNSFLARSQKDSSSITTGLDSLLNLGLQSANVGAFEKAHSIIEVARNLVIQTKGIESIEYGEVCHFDGIIFYRQGDYLSAEQLMSESLTIRKRILGVDNAEYLSSVGNLASLYKQMANFPKAEELFTEAKEGWLKLKGKESREYATNIANFGSFFMQVSQFDRALESYLEALDIRDKLLGRDHPEYLNNLMNLGRLYKILGEYDKAESLLRNSLNGWLKLDKNYLAVAGVTQSILADLFRETANFDSSEMHFRQAEQKLESILGKEHPEYLGILINHAALFAQIGNFDQAEISNLEILRLLEEINYLDHPWYAGTLNNLASIYLNKGLFEKSEQLYLQSLAIVERLLSKDHRDYARSLNNIALLYSQLGIYSKAKEYYQQALMITDKILGANHIDYASTLDNLAQLYTNVGDYDGAISLLEKSGTIIEKDLGRDHPMYASNLLHRANLNLDLRKLENAGLLYQMALDGYENSFGLDCTDCALVISGLARLRVLEGRYGEAEGYLKHAMAIQLKEVGHYNSGYISNMEVLSELMEKRGDIKVWRTTLLEITALKQELLKHAIYYLSELELQGLLSVFSKHQHQLYSYLFGRQNDTEMVEVAYDNALFYKEFLQTFRQKLNELSDSDSTLAHDLNTLRSLYFIEASKYTADNRGDSKLDDITSKIDVLEKSLARRSKQYSQAKISANWKDIQNNLKSDEAAIEFIQFIYTGSIEKDSSLYAALLVRPGYLSPQFIFLFEEEQLRTVLDSLKWGSEKSMGQRRKDIKDHDLYNLLWRPLEPYLEDVKKVNFSPSGLLHRVPISSIITDNSLPISDRFDFHQFGSTREVGKNQDDLKSHVTTAGKVAIFGGIRYDLNSSAMILANQNLTSERTHDTIASGSDLGGFIPTLSSAPENWSYLPWTEVEAKEISGIFQRQGIRPELFLGYDATEENFRFTGGSKPSPQVLHIATHGYFFENPTNSSHQELSHRPSRFSLIEHPLIRSGLIMAGANHVWTGGEPIENLGDGILTAYEVSQMDLSETELVVLSACETGLGDIKGNEGVYGLQRAFKLAGVKYIVMSLWQVPDFATQELMTVFYNLWLKEGKDLPEAFRQAQLTIRAKRPDPFYWAGFVLLE